MNKMTFLDECNLVHSVEIDFIPRKRQKEIVTPVTSLFRLTVLRLLAPKNCRIRKKLKKVNKLKGRSGPTAFQFRDFHGKDRKTLRSLQAQSVEVLVVIEGFP